MLQTLDHLREFQYTAIIQRRKHSPAAVRARTTTTTSSRLARFSRYANKSLGTVTMSHSVHHAIRGVPEFRNSRVELLFFSPSRFLFLYSARQQSCQDRHL